MVIKMRTGFQELTDEQLNRELEDRVLLPRLRNILAERIAGHCMRVTDLDAGLMRSLAEKLRRDLPNSQVYILGEATTSEKADGLYASSTKLVELRNPLAGEELRPPLLVLIPPNLRTSVEDSLSVATFEDLPMSDAYYEMVKILLEDLPPDYRGSLKKQFAWLGKEWQWADTVAQVRFLLTVISNGKDVESVGAALYELGLAPDFKLPIEPAAMESRLRQNLESMRKLVYSDLSPRGRVLDLGLLNKETQRHLTNYLVEVNINDPSWTRAIALDRSHSSTISWDKWELRSSIYTEQISIFDVETDLPLVSDDDDRQELQGLAGQYYLAPKSNPKLSVNFKVDPMPNQVAGLDHFTAQIFSEEGGPIGAAKKVKAGSKAKHLIKLDKLSKVEFEEGWHFVRVLAWTKDGDLISLAGNRGSTGGALLRGPNESELFYIIPEGRVEEEMQQRAIQQEDSLEHARMRHQFTALQKRSETDSIKPQSVSWVDKSTSARPAKTLMVEVKFERQVATHLPVSRKLSEIEQRILDAAEEPQSWRLHIEAGKVEEPRPEPLPLVKTAAMESFLAARREYFTALNSSGRGMISQAADFIALASLCAKYADAYRDLLFDLQAKIERSEGNRLHELIMTLRRLIALDLIRISITDFTGSTKEAALLGPTHPLRALWLATWAKLGQNWIEAIKQGPASADDYISVAREAILERLALLNFPVTVPLANGRVFASVDNIHPLWALYASPTEANPRGLLSEVCDALGIDEPPISGASITAKVLASRLERYLIQHPYLRTFVINAFNAGRAVVLAEAITELLQRDEFSHLRFDIRLFVPDPEAPGIGQAMEEILFLNDEADSESDDSISSATLTSGTHLFPKLSLAVHDTKQFQRTPEKFRAHISILFDLFPAAEVGFDEPFRSDGRAPVHGLVQDFVIKYLDDEDQFWQRQPRHGMAQSLREAEDLTDLLAELPKLMSGATATSALGHYAFSQHPIITLRLDMNQRRMIHDVHDVSDWVFTIDRNLGIEFFDHGKRSERPDYLIDYVPSSSPNAGHKLIITSRSLAEIQAMLSPVLQRHGLSDGQKQAALILEQLRALSGRLALKLLSSDTHQKEALGMALARLFLCHQGALSNQTIVPLDVHIDLFRAAKKQADEVGQESTLQRTDLALLDLNAVDRIITCHLVEVKCHDNGASLGAYQQLKPKITAQLDESENVLRRHFDIQFKNPDRPDRLLKTKELSSLVEFYLDRSCRYGLIEKEAAEEARALLDTLEDGYDLRFTRSGLIFDFEKPGTEAPEFDGRTEFHRIGVDLIRALVEADESPSSDSISIPKLTTAAFIAPPRERSTTYSVSEVISPVQSENRAENAGALPISTQDDVSSSAVPQSTESTEEGEPALPSTIIETATLLKSENLSNSNESPAYDAVLGVSGTTPQYGILGEISGRKVALDLNQTHTISLFGVQGGGKSYTLGSIVEMACAPIPNVNELPQPLATVIFHYSPTQDYKPEFTSMVNPNDDATQITALRDCYGAEPKSLSDVLILAPQSKVAERQAEYPDIEIQPITFAAAELKAPHWKFLMSAVGSQSLYLRQITLMMRRFRENLTLENLRDAVEESGLPEHLKELARTRLDFAAEYISDERRLSDFVKPGRLIIVDLRDEFIEKDEALGLFVVMLQVFAEAEWGGKSFNKLVVFDEAHKYIESPDLISGLIEVVREMRHKGTSILVASQDPPSVPVTLIELSSQIILHKFNSPAWLKHIQKANAALEVLSPKQMSELGPGEAYVWSSKASDDFFTRSAVKIRCRPRVTKHGGGTKTAV
jgi:hypothetical protein